MIEVVRIGENATHDRSFEINRPAGHPVYLLLLVKTTARFWVSDSWQETAPNTAVIFKPNQLHKYCANNTDYQNDWMHFQSNTALLGEHFPFGCPIALHRPEDYYDLFHLIYNEFYSVSLHRNLIINNLMAALLDKISDESNTKAYPDIYYALTKLREQIYRFPDRDWRVESMAAGLNISVGYLHSLYRYYFNTTCMSDVIQSRIQYSYELLASNNKSISEIAEVCGYHSTEHFIRQFKAVTGMTPGKYRNQDSAHV